VENLEATIFFFVETRIVRVFAMTANVSIKIVNVTGQTILENDHLSGNNFTVNISYMANGIYFVQVIINGKNKRIKVMKE